MTAPAPKQRNRNHEDMNEKMISLVPELDSEYALSPLQFDRWRTPEEKVDSGDPCFLPSPTDQGLKKDYIYAPQRKGTKDEHVGYYHFRTQEAHILAYQRLIAEGPSCCCWTPCCASGDPVYKQVQRLLYNRTVSPDPDDILAARAALLGSQTRGDAAGRFGKAAYLPTLVTVLLVGTVGG